MDLSSETQLQSAVNTVLEEATAPLYLIRPSAALLDQFVRASMPRNGPRVHVFAAEPALKAIRDHFPSGARAAELVEIDRLTLATTVPDGWGTAVVADETVYSFAQVADDELVFEASTAPASLRETCAGTHESAEAFDLRTPAWSTATETFAEAFSPAIRDDFETSMETLDGLAAPAINEVETVLLVAAANELLLYDLSHWAEDVQFCSRATFSRMKNGLADLDVVTTEKVPMDVGRPRQRLLLTDAYTDHSLPEVLREAASLKQA